MKPALFTDDDMNAVDLEIKEAAEKAASGFYDPITKTEDEFLSDLAADIELELGMVDLNIAEELSLEVYELNQAVETTDNKIDLDFSELDLGPSLIEPEVSNNHGNEIFKSSACASLAVIIASVVTGIVIGDLANPNIWIWSPGVITLILLITRKWVKLPYAAVEMALCMHLVSSGKMLTDLVTQGGSTFYNWCGLIAGVSLAALVYYLSKGSGGGEEMPARRDEPRLSDI